MTNEKASVIIGNIPVYGDERYSIAEYQEAKTIAVQTLLQEPKMWEWIPVSERLPKENRTVIASTEYVVYPEARYTKGYGWEWAYESGADYWKEIDEDVTAWMPLPERYKPQESEE